MQPVQFFCYEGRCVQKVVKILCLTHAMTVSLFSGAVIYHISNINDVLQYTHAALYNTSVIFLTVQNMLVGDFEIIIMKMFAAALMDITFRILWRHT